MLAEADALGGWGLVEGGGGADAGLGSVGSDEIAGWGGFLGVLGGGPFDFDA